MDPVFPPKHIAFVPTADADKDGLTVSVRVVKQPVGSE
jgi:hypothetical protein